MKKYVIITERPLNEEKSFEFVSVSTVHEDLNEALKEANQEYERAINNPYILYKREEAKVKICVIDPDDFIYIRFKGGESNDDGMQD